MLLGVIIRHLAFWGILLLVSCGGIPKAPDLEGRYGLLPQKETRQLIKHWSHAGFPAEIQGRPVRVINRHPELSAIEAITPAGSFSDDDGRSGVLGSLAMAHPQTHYYTQPLGSHLWQISSQPATVLASVSQDSSIELEFRDFRDTPFVNGQRLASRSELTFDYIKEQEPEGLVNLLTLIDPRLWSERRGFYLGTPYDPEKIPLVFVHGLLSTPVAFEKLASAIAAEPDLWDRYQLWYYFYPTGDPWILSAAHFRRDFRRLTQLLDPENDDLPLRKETTIIAHSMGGLITRLSLSEQPQPLYDHYFTRPLNQLRLLPYQKNRIRDQLLFEPLAEPSKVIFLATPHSGSKLAGGFPLWLARTLVKAPARILDTTFNTAQIFATIQPQAITPDGYALLTGNEVSVNGLAPGHPALACLEQMPIRKGVELHNIVASLTGPDGSIGDGVVPLDSARLKQADTETIIRGNHWLVNDPEAHRAVIRLLRN
ncbi:MAG: hypothetical protein Q7Q71_05905 [Verrucomicrobiota bacterium JB023]|nr:hypothetical protein [Verrucomicrobiota bacterium JB023]